MRLGEEKQKKKTRQKQIYPLQNSNKKSSPFGLLACKTFPHILEEEKKQNKKQQQQNKKKGLPSKRHKRLVHLNKPFRLVPPEKQFNQDLSAVSFYSEWDLY